MLNIFLSLCSLPPSRLPARVSCDFHHVSVDLLANHLHQAHEPPEGGVYVRAHVSQREIECNIGSNDGFCRRSLQPQTHIHGAFFSYCILPPNQSAAAIIDQPGVSVRSDCGVMIGVKFCCCCCCGASCFHCSAVNCPEWWKVISQLCGG